MSQEPEWIYSTPESGQVVALPSPDPWSYDVFCGPSALVRPQRALPSVSMARLEPAPERPYPAPEVTSRDGAPVPEKQAVADLAQHAVFKGWAVVTTFARGCPPHAKLGTPLAVRDSIAVRLSRGKEWAVAVYSGGSTWAWDTLYVNGRRHETITAFKEAL